MKFVVAASAAALFAFALSPAALAGHGKAGLWQTTIQVAGHSMTHKSCMTAADVAADKPVYKQQPNCTVQNQKMAGNTYSADVVCTGQMSMKSHMQITWDSAEHYSVLQSTDMNMGGQAMHTSTNFESKWISPDCGSTK